MSPRDATAINLRPVINVLATTMAVIVASTVALRVGFWASGTIPWIIYAICFPLLFYDVFLFSRQRYHNGLTHHLCWKTLSIVSIALVSVVVADGVSQLLYMNSFRSLVKNDWRYDLYVNG